MAILINHQGRLANGCDYVTVKTDNLAEYDATDCSYAMGYKRPNYPVPAMIGKVVILDGYYSYEVIVTDCDKAFDPRLCIAILKYRDNEVITDYPHNSPNYR